MFHWQIGEAERELESRKRDYLTRWGWESTCSTPGSYWIWRRDFKNEDAARNEQWLARGPGPLGWSSQPSPYGVITASTDLAVSMTVSSLDEQPECNEAEEDDDEAEE